MVLAFFRSVRLLLLLLVLIAKNSLAEPMVLIHGDSPDGLEPKNAYRAALYAEIMQVTAEEFGVYEIKSNTTSNGAALRQAILISQGAALNLLWASPGTPIAKANVYEIPIDIMQGLMGNRVCLTTPKGVARLTGVSTLSQLRNQVRLLQGKGWADVAIYEHNGIRVGVGENFEGLFGMVASGNYDCLPLGVDEAAAILSVRKQKYPNLMIDSELLIYYDYPIYLYVSKNNPLLAKRVEKGLRMLQESGEMQHLFDRHYRALVENMHLAGRNRICISSPYSSSNESCKKM